MSFLSNESGKFYSFDEDLPQDIERSHSFKFQKSDPTVLDKLRCFLCCSRIKKHELPKLMTEDEWEESGRIKPPWYKPKSWISDGSMIWGTSWILANTQFLFWPRVRQFRPLILCFFGWLGIAGLLLLCYGAMTAMGSYPIIVGCFQTGFDHGHFLVPNCVENTTGCNSMGKTGAIWKCQSQCLHSWSKPVRFHGDSYDAKGRICASAIHANVIHNEKGGCFRMTYTDSRSIRNQYSEAMKFESIPGGQNCNLVSFFVDMYVIILAFILCVLIRPNTYFVYIAGSIAGPLWSFVDNAQSTKYNLEFVENINTASSKIMICLIFSMALWSVSLKHTVPSPKTAPLDIFIFYFLPFWLGIRLELLEFMGIDMTLTSGVFSSSADVIGLVVLLVLLVPPVISQIAIYILAKRIWKFLYIVASACLVVVIITITTKKYLSIHLHHWIFGMIGALFFQGQPRSRLSIAFGGFAHGVVLNGIVVYGIAPLFDYKTKPASNI